MHKFDKYGENSIIQHGLLYGHMNANYSPLELAILQKLKDNLGREARVVRLEAFHQSLPDSDSYKKEEVNHSLAVLSREKLIIDRPVYLLSWTLGRELNITSNGLLVIRNQGINLVK
jgi:hypothetical protein